MRSKSIILFALAIGCGLVASIGISQVMDRNKAPVDNTEKQPVFVALTDINANEPLTAQNVKLEEWPKNILPSGALTKLEEVENKRVRMKVYAGEPILANKLLGAADQTNAANQIPEGYRVAHVKVDSITGGSNLIVPGDRVDVLVFRQTNSDMNATAAKIVLQDIKVFAVDTQTETEFTRVKGEQTEPMSAKIIQLLVTPEQAVKLHVASEISGSVRLVLRNPEDDKHIASQGATVGDIFGPDEHGDRKAELGDKGEEKESMTAWLNQQKEKVEPPPAPAVPSGPARKMVVIMGSQIAQVEFPPGGGPPRNQPGSTQPNGDPSSSGPQNLSPSQFTGGDDGDFSLPSDGQDIDTTNDDSTQDEK